MSAMTYEDARQAVYTRFQTYMTATYPTVILAWENRISVDLLAQVLPFVTIEVEFLDGEQASIEINPIHRVHGAICLAVFVREYEGAALPNTYLKNLGDLFKSTTFSGVNTYAAKPMPGEEKLGWWKRSIRVPFYYNEIP